MKNRHIRLQFLGLTVCLQVAFSGLIDTIDYGLGRYMFIPRIIALVLSLCIYLALINCIKHKTDLHVIMRIVFTVYSAGIALLIAFIAAKMWVAWSLSAYSVFLFAGALTALAIYGASRGKAAVARLSVLITVMLLVVFILDSLLLIPQMSVSRLTGSFPVSSLAPRIVEYAVLDLLVLLLPLPLLIYLQMINANIDEAKQGVRRGIVVSSVYYLVQSLRSVLLLGDLIRINDFPLLRALKMVEFGIGLSNVEFIGILLMMMTCCVGVIAAASIAWENIRRNDKNFAKQGGKALNQD